MPPWPKNQAEFGVQTDTGGQPYVLARALGLFATASKLMIKTVLGRFDDAERALLTQLLPHRRSERSIGQADRGFPSVWLYTLLQQRQLSFRAWRQMAIKAACGATLFALRFSRNRCDVTGFPQGAPPSQSLRPDFGRQNADVAFDSSHIVEWSN
ncbi:MAG: hypothetical protein ACRD82_21920 [Blastocatellia bacterium]